MTECFEQVYFTSKTLNTIVMKLRILLKLFDYYTKHIDAKPLTWLEVYSWFCPKWFICIFGNNVIKGKVSIVPIFPT